MILKAFILWGVSLTAMLMFMGGAHSGEDGVDLERVMGEHYQRSRFRDAVLMQWSCFRLN